MKKIVIIFGYNNTRTYDIERLKKLCYLKFKADILLCKEKINQQDKNISPYTLEINLEIKNSDIINNQIKEIDNYLLQHNLDVIACLPFSDKGIPLGSYFAKYKKLPHDDCNKSYACIDKYTFRCLEAEESTPTWYRKPFFTRVYSYQEAKIIVYNKNIPLFFKPTTEGNSRGCIEINSLDDLIKHKDLLDPYFSQGVIIEECIKDFDEYSFDGIDGNYVITEKKTSQGYYRVETQHIVPAPLPPYFYDRLMTAGMIVSNISGSKNGAVHNELFLNKITGEVFCVEPNRRPAGLKLWDWINTAYPAMNNWDRWLEWATATSNPPSPPTINDFYVGCKMLQSPVCGTLIEINEQLKTFLLEKNEIIELVINKPLGSKITSIPKDNSDFIGYVVCKSKSVFDLRKLLESVSTQALTICTFQKSSQNSLQKSD